MDADCLIKLTKAGLKESIGKHVAIVIPEMVQREVVEAGKDKGYPDAALVERNIAAGLIQITGKSSSHRSGDDALVTVFQGEEYDAVATDDRKLTRILKAANVPFILPGLILYSLKQQGLMNQETALRSLDQLAPFISNDEYSTVRLLLEGRS
ncbi:MAG: hypothetical protein HYY65_14100 [Candidatus Tectomicrobia bacterium]|uniref:PIN domain-containing protein n=1 Tax=Tectimicrobiota bacterium TaxID=2528274 RepID=A0A932GSA9_UNCTE|nr:hypothetical protein [Candidatus Tectomicrobia bacterium]